MKKVRIALVGCGSRGIGVANLFNTHDNCEITTLMDPYPKCMENARNQLKLQEVKEYTNFDKMLTDAPVDALFIASDPLVQVDQACQAMEKGIHACTEVPAAFSIDECWKLVNTVEKTGCKYQLMEQTRYWGFIDTWKKMYDAGEFGHICQAQGEYIHFYPKRAWLDPETGELIDGFLPPEGKKVETTWRYEILANPIYYLPHTLSPLLKILNDRVVSVSCMGTQKESYTYPGQKVPFRDIEYALMHTEKDTVLMVGAGFSMPHVLRGPLSSHWYELRGPKGSVTSPRYPEDSFRVWKEGSETYEKIALSPYPLDASEEQKKSGHGGADFKPVDTFLQSIIKDTTPPMDVFLSVETAAPAILAAKSAELGGKLLDVPDFRKKN